ncbi:MAG: phosphoglycerate kinase [Alistipes sp.]|nr:phosphoglycerate kinase [Alistipes sp.]MBQ7297213.1 phosphoglycerate kinase [Alistipes sp.]
MISIDKYDFKGKRAIIRVDFNVPVDAEGNVTDDTRIRAAAPTIKKVLAEGGAVILMSHMGRPKKNPDMKYTLEQIIPAVEKNLGVKVQFAGDCMGEKAAEMCKNIQPGEVVLLENLRFYAEEEGKPRGLAEDATKEEKDAAKKALKEGPQKEFVKKLASYADCYINDAFGTAHRKHASTYLIAKHFPNDKMFGYLMEKEVKAISEVMEQPQRPFCAIIGGSKVSSKIGVIKALLDKCDSIIIGGGMTYTFAGARGGEVGKSICEPDMFPVALDILKTAEEKGVKLVMSPDALICDQFSEEANTQEASVMSIPAEWEGVDIASQGKAAFREHILGCKTILWNGPVGVFEINKFSTGSKVVADAIAEATKHGAFSLIGGGDSVACINKFGLGDEVSYISTGGGALLEYIEFGDLPGVAAIRD